MRLACCFGPSVGVGPLARLLGQSVSRSVGYLHASAHTHKADTAVHACVYVHVCTCVCVQKSLIMTFFTLANDRSHCVFGCLYSFVGVVNCVCTLFH